MIAYKGIQMRKSLLLCFIFIGIFIFSTMDVFAGGKKDTSEPASSGQARRNMEEAFAEIDSQNQGIASSGPLYTGDGGRGKSIAIFRPNGVNVRQPYLLDFIQGAFISYFSTYSGIEVSDRFTVNEVHDQRAYEEKNLSDDRIRARVGEEVGAQFTMGGALTWRQDAGNYQLFLVITDNTKQTNVASIEPVVCTKEEIEDFSRLRPIAFELLQKMGVTLTTTGRNKLFGIDNDEIDFLNAQARGIAAAQSGGDGAINIAAMNYLYQAQTYKQTASDAEQYLAYLKKTQGSNRDIGNDIQAENRAYEAWLKTLADFNAFYTDHPPFDFYYTPPHEVSRDVTVKKYKLSFQAGLRWNADSIAVMQRVLDDINNGLNETGKRAAWKLNDWTTTHSTLFRGPNNFKYNITADVINRKGERFTRLNFTLDAGLIINGNTIGANAEQEISLVSGDLTIDMNRDMSGFAIRIIDINKIDAEEAGRNGIVKITMVENMPAQQKQSAAAIKAVATVDRAQAAADRERKRVEQRTWYKNATLNDIRFGVNAGVSMLFEGEKKLEESEWKINDDGTVNKTEPIVSSAFLGGFEFGLKLWYLETNGIVGPNLHGFDLGTGIGGWFDIRTEAKVGASIGGGLSLLTYKETILFSPYLSAKGYFNLNSLSYGGGKRFIPALYVAFVGRFFPKEVLDTSFLPGLNTGLAFYWK
ncbi:hypothetical protein FACS189479_02780 [Spirochaetia bacterium]|nr:hypothetical protein FACS189479_02780 [Spirochaetia bacterium]